MFPSAVLIQTDVIELCNGSLLWANQTSLSVNHVALQPADQEQSSLHTGERFCTQAGHHDWKAVDRWRGDGNLQIEKQHEENKRMIDKNNEVLLSRKNEQLVNNCLMAGKLYDSEGNRRKWWSNSTLSNFHRNSRCLEDQYSNFTFYGSKVVESKLLNYLSSSISVFILLLEIDCRIFVGGWTEDIIGEYSWQWRC